MKLFASIAFVCLLHTAALAVDCGDTTGPDGTRMPCACGDTVTTNTLLRPTDPVVSTVCGGDGLTIGADALTLDCRKRVLRGSGFGRDVKGIVLDARTGVTVQYCVAENFGIGIIAKDSEHLTLVHNTLRANVYGILFNGVTDSRVERNQVSGNLTDGLFIEDCSSNTLTKNTVANNGEDGIKLNFAATGNLILANTITGNDDDGIAVHYSNADSNFMIDNVVKDNDDDGTLVFADNNMLAHNQVTNNGGDGIDVMNGSGNLLGVNRGSGNDGHGINVEVSGQVLSNNTFNRNAGHGICAVAGNVDGGGNEGKNNGVLPDVTFEGC